jgi:type VI protein secretion system component Hcp
LPALTLGLDSYQFGFKNATTSNPATGAAAAGKATFDDLKVTAPLQATSPQLLGVLSAGSHYPTAVLTQRDAAGDSVAEWVLGTVFISSDVIQNDSAAVPTETLLLTFDSLTEVISAHTASWSQVTRSNNGPAAPDAVIAALPPLAAPALTLKLQPSSGQPAVTLGLDSYQFGTINKATIAIRGLVPGKARFLELEVSAPLSEASPQLFGMLTAGRHCPTAVLTQRDAAGDPVAEWVLGDGLLTSDVIVGGGAAVPTEALHLVFDSMTEATSAQTVSWNQLTNNSNGPVSPDGVTLAELPLPAAPALTLELQPFSGSDMLAMTLGLKSYQFGLASQVTIDPRTGKPLVSSVALSDLYVSAPLSEASPQLFAALVTGGRCSTAVLTQRDAAGDPVAEWVLDSVLVTYDVIDGDSAAVPTETLQLAFGSMTEVTAAHTASWNQITNSNDGPKPPGGVTLAELPLPAAPALTLELQPSSGLPAVTLGLDSYQFGFVSQGPLGVNGGPFFQDLDVLASLNGASPQLFAALVAGGHYSTAVLTQRDAAGDPVAEWVLGNPILRGDHIAGNGSAVPTEGLTVYCDSVTEVTATQTASWNQITNSDKGPEPPGGVTLAELPLLAAPTLTLELKPLSGSPLPAVTLGLDSYDFGQIGRLNYYLSLDASASLSAASPQLFAALVAQRRYSTAVLTQRDAASDPVAEWVLGNPILTVDRIAGSSSALPTESLQLAFDTLTEVTSAHAGSWSRLTQSNIGPAAPDGVTLAALPALTSPALTLELQPSSASTLAAVTLGLDSYQFGFTNATTIDAATGGAVAGKVFFDLGVAAPLSAAAPQLFAALVADRNYSTAVLTQRNAAGDPVAEWVLGTVVIFSDDIHNDSAAVPTEAPQLVFDSVTEVTAADTASWNRITKTSNGPALPAGVTLVPLGAVTPTVAVTDNGGVYNGAAFAVTAATVSAGAAALATLGDGSLTFIYYVGSSVSGPSSATAPIDAGTYTVVAHFSSAQPNYYTDADSAPVVFTITPAPLTITADNQTKIAGESNPTFTASYSSFVLGQGPDALGGALTVSTLATVGSPPGPYVITPGGLTSGNYAITFVDGTLTVLSAGQATNELLLQVSAARLPAALKNDFTNQLQAAIDLFNRGKMIPGVTRLSAFMQHVRAQRGKKIDAGLADVLMAGAQRIIAAVG